VYYEHKRTELEEYIESDKTTNKSTQDWEKKKNLKLMLTVIAAKVFPSDAAK
jgi:hypothetical protein